MYFGRDDGRGPPNSSQNSQNDAEARKARLAAKRQAELDALEASFQRRHGGRNSRFSGGGSSRQRSSAVRARGSGRRSEPGAAPARGQSRDRSRYPHETARNSTRGQVTQPPPRYAASTSHHDNRQYMTDFHQAYASLAGEDFDPSSVLEDRPRGSGIPEGLDMRTTGHQLVTSGKVPLRNVARYIEGPIRPAGIHMDASPRNIVCMSVFDGEVVVGSCDHGLYAFDYRTGERRRTLYNKRFGHEAWVTCVEHLPDGRLLSAGMDSRLCLWGRKSTRCENLEGHSKSISAINVSNDGAYRL